MGRRHRDVQQQRRRAAAAASPGNAPSRRRDWSGTSRYLADVAAILLIALALNLVLIEAGMVNQIARIVVALVIARIVVSLGRRFLESR